MGKTGCGWWASVAMIASRVAALDLILKITSNKPITSLFVDFQNKFHLEFQNDREKKEAYVVFSKNVEYVKTENCAKNRLFQLGINGFSHLTWEKFKERFLMKKGERFRAAHKAQETIHRFDPNPEGQPSDPQLRHLDATMSDEQLVRAIHTLPAWVNWGTITSPVKDQANCSSCYAFSAVGAYETLINQRYGKKFTLSEQEILDCSPYAEGCVGGNPADVFLYAQESGLSRDTSYKYQAKAGKCRNLPFRQKIRTPLRFRYLNPDIYTILKAISQGPIIIIHTVNENFKSYKSGVFDDPKCTDALDHSAVAVGYDLTAPTPYIYMKNAWGAGWGEKGFYKLAIGPLKAGSKGTCMMLTHNYNAQPYF